MLLTILTQGNILKKLILMRHAEAPHNNSMFDDFNRNLSDNGFAQAKQSALHIINSNIRIDKILCSTALRTKQTLEVMQHNGIDVKSEFMDEIYKTSEEGMIKIIKNQSESTILIIGHNPTISYTYFAAVNNYSLEHFAPGTCAILDYDILSWEEAFSNLPTKYSIFIPEGIK